MQMDILFWNNLNAGLQLQPTAKRYFGKYFWRMCVRVPGGRLIHSKAEDLQVELELRRMTERRMINWGGSWAWRKNTLSQEVDLDLLSDIREFARTHQHAIKLRIEEPKLQIYTQDEQMLKSFAHLLGNNKIFIEEIHGVMDTDHESILESDAIICKHPVKYSHKVMLREGTCAPEIKQQILNYLESLEDLVDVSEGTKRELLKPFSSIWGAFFYTNDPSVITFLNLIQPGIVRKIHPLVYRDQ